MSREIKFRAWDKETNKYFEPAYQAYMGRLEELTIALSGRLQKRTCRGVADESMFPGRYVVEQYTGLKDANGKDIYEGDIIKVSDETGSLFVSVVKYFDYDDYPAFDLDPQYIPTNWYFEANILSTLKDDGTEIKVVGNVHANPELLEESNE